MYKLVGALLLTTAAFAQQSTVTIEDKNITVKYAPAGDKIAAGFHTDADLVFKGVTVPKGDYTLYVLNDGPAWQLVINLATGAKPAARDPKLDIGKVALAVTRSAASPNKVTLSKIAALAAKIEIVSGGNLAAAQFHLDKVAGDSEW